MLTKSGIRPGSEIWACNYKTTEDKEGLRYIQLPIKGMVACAKNQELHEKLMKSEEPDLRYFVPFKKNGKGLAWSKAVELDSRLYATTEEDSKEMYNEEIEYYIHKWEKEIEDLKAKLLK